MIQNHERNHSHQDKGQAKKKEWMERKTTIPLELSQRWCNLGTLLRYMAFGSMSCSLKSKGKCGGVGNTAADIWLQTNLPDNSPAPSPIAIIPVFAIWWEGPSVRYSFSPVNSSCWKEQFFSQLWGHCLWWCLNPVCFPLWVFLFQPKWKTTSWALPVVFPIPPACGNSCPEIFFLYLPEPD